MIIDHGTDNACIKIEDHYSTENSRQNKLVFFKDNQSYYKSCFDDYEAISKQTSKAPIILRSQLIMINRIIITNTIKH